MRTTVASADMGDIILSFFSSFSAFSRASADIFFCLIFSSSSWISFLNSSFSPSSFWIARICSLR